MKDKGTYYFCHALRWKDYIGMKPYDERRKMCEGINKKTHSAGELYKTVSS
jgi:hypothetical protein